MGFKNTSVTMTLAALQLKDALLRMPAAIDWAWNAISSSV